MVLRFVSPAPKGKQFLVLVIVFQTDRTPLRQQRTTLFQRRGGICEAMLRWNMIDSEQGLGFFLIRSRKQSAYMASGDCSLLLNLVNARQRFRDTVLGLNVDLYSFKSTPFLEDPMTTKRSLLCT